MRGRYWDPPERAGVSASNGTTGQRDTWFFGVATHPHEEEYRRCTALPASVGARRYAPLFVGYAG